jgi:hypothetical protein
MPSSYEDKTPRELASLTLDDGKVTSLGVLPDLGRPIELRTFDQGVCVLLSSDKKQPRVFQQGDSFPFRELDPTETSPCLGGQPGIEKGKLLVLDGALFEAVGGAPLIKLIGRPHIAYSPNGKLAALEVPHGGILSDRLLVDLDKRVAYDVTNPKVAIAYGALQAESEREQGHGFYDSGMGDGMGSAFFLSDTVLVAGPIFENATMVETLVLLLPSRTALHIGGAEIVRP